MTTRRHRRTRPGLSWRALPVAMAAAGLLTVCGPPPPPEDTCGGVRYGLQPDQPVSAEGTFTLLDADYRPYCSGASGVDAVYTLEPLAGGTLLIDVVSDVEVTVFVWSPDVCGDQRRQTHCVPSAEDVAHIGIPVEPGVGYSVAIKAQQEGPSGSYEARFELVAAACGDGARSSTEECDFGAENAASGCDPTTCQRMAGDPGADRCPGFGQPGQIAPNTVYSESSVPELAGFTSGDSDDYPSLAKNGAPDRVYELHPIATGELTVKATASFDVVLSAYLEGCNAGTGALDGLVAFADSGQATADETLTFDVTALADYYLVVDGYDAESFGHYALEIRLTPEP